jgi:hypothetical protein
MIYKWNHIICSLWDSIFPLSIKLWRPFKVLHMSSFFLFFSSAIWNEYTTVRFSILLIKTSVLVSFWLLQTKLLWLLFFNFLYEHKLYFSEINAQVLLSSNMVIGYFILGKIGIEILQSLWKHKLFRFINNKIHPFKMIKARAHKGGVRIGKTPKKLASICCP